MSAAPDDTLGLRSLRSGASGYLYNDEAGMPYNYLFARTYTFIHDTLSDDERRAQLENGWPDAIQLSAKDPADVAALHERIVVTERGVPRHVDP